MTLDQLDRWLFSDDAPDDSMMLSDLDGFLTALIVGPVFVHPETWLPSVWGTKHIVQPAGRNGERALQAIVARYNEISAMLADTPGIWAPIFLQHPDGTPIPGDWAEGFFDAIKLSIDAWAPFMADLETAKHLTMILVYCGDNEGQNLLPIPPELRDQILGTAHRLIPESVIAIRAACMPARVAQAKADAAPDRRKSPRADSRRRQAHNGVGFVRRLQPSPYVACRSLPASPLHRRCVVDGAKAGNRRPIRGAHEQRCRDHAHQTTWVERAEAGGCLREAE